MRLLFFFALLSLSSLQAASLEEWFDKSNILAKHNSSEFSNSNLGVNYIGGDGLARAQVVDINPVHIALPKFSAGCGGIDYTMGAINLVSKDDLIKAMKSIISNGGAYAFQLALQTATPSVAATAGRLQEYANHFNSMNINSCEAAQSLVNAAWPASEAADKFICEQAGGKSLFKDQIERRHRCHQDKNVVKKAIKKTKEGSDMIIGDYNVAYSVLKDMEGLDGDARRLLLNLTGTVVSKNDKITIYPPKDMKGFDVLLNGGTLSKAYKFSSDSKDSNFAHIVEEDMSIPIGKAWKPQIEDNLKSILSKIKTGRSGSGELSPEEETILNGSKLPLGTLLVILSRGDADSSLISLSDYARIEAHQRLTDFLSLAIYEIRVRAHSLEKAQVNEEILRDYLEKIDQVKANLNFEQEKIERKVMQVNNMEEWLRKKEESLRAMMGD
ncbi:MAG: hypothetical protein K1060chlam2_00588 [Chlamydiae bacterium]|nr:hypothetical protein [Chlamydiota bacterium]